MPSNNQRYSRYIRIRKPQQRYLTYLITTTARQSHMSHLAVLAQARVCAECDFNGLWSRRYSFSWLTSSNSGSVIATWSVWLTWSTCALYRSTYFAVIARRFPDIPAKALERNNARGFWSDKHTTDRVQQECHLSRKFSRSTDWWISQQKVIPVFSMCY